MKNLLKTNIFIYGLRKNETINSTILLEPIKEYITNLKVLE